MAGCPAFRSGRRRERLSLFPSAFFLLGLHSMWCYATPLQLRVRVEAKVVVGGGSSSRSRMLLQMNAACSKSDIAIYQGPTSPLPSGIPAFTVEILNVCVSDCYITNIHVNCGWFSSVRLVNPQVFRRVDYDNCVVNNGEVLSPGQSLSFQYANSFQYPLSVSSVDCS